MKAKPARKDQGNFLYEDLIDQLNPKHPLLQLGKRIPWERFEQELSPLCSEHGRPAKPIRLMVGLMILKQLENLSDERVIEAWVQNPYYQAFCGETHFQWKFLATTRTSPTSAGESARTVRASFSRFR